MVASQKKKEILVRLQELELARPFISTDYYWKRVKQLESSKTTQEELETLQMNGDDV
jgi:hypothetical protein